MDQMKQKRAELNALYREAKGERLDQTEAFVRWLDKLDAKGNAMFEMFCPVCKGNGELSNSRKRSPVPCPRCDKGGTVVGPDYCKQCGTILPHLPAEKCLG